VDPCADNEASILSVETPVDYSVDDLIYTYATAVVAEIKNNGEVCTGYSPSISSTYFNDPVTSSTVTIDTASSPFSLDGSNHLSVFTTNSAYVGTHTLNFEIVWDYPLNKDTGTFDQTIINVDRCLEGSGTVDITSASTLNYGWSGTAISGAPTATYTDINGVVCSSPDLIFNI
jgi:hypothetical protein